MAEAQEYNILAFFDNHPTRQLGLMKLIREIKDEENTKATTKKAEKTPKSTSDTPKSKGSTEAEVTYQPGVDTPGRSKRKRSEEVAVSQLLMTGLAPTTTQGSSVNLIPTAASGAIPKTPR